MNTYGYIAAMASIIWSVDVSAQISVTPDTLDFGPSRIGVMRTDTVSISTSATTSFLVSSILLDHDRFALSPSPLTSDALVIQAIDTLRVPVSYAPETEATHTSSVEITIDGASHTVRLFGEGVREPIVINEILADPPTGEAGDANGDGTRHSSEDEFVEVLNLTHRTIQVGGWTLSDRGATLAKRFSFPEGATIGPGERIVLFGGGSPTGIPGQVYVDDGKIGGGLTNSGDAVYLISAAGDTMASAVYGKEAGADQSIVRHPDGRGPFVRHATPPATTRFSPGSIRPTVSALLVDTDSQRVVIGDRFVPDVFAVSEGGDTVDVSDESAWTSTDQAVMPWNTDGFEAALPGTTTIRAYFDSIASSAIPVIATFPASFTLRPAHVETVALLGSEFSLGASLVADPNIHADLTPILNWTPSDPSLITVLDPRRFRAEYSGSLTFSTQIQSMSLETLVTLADRGDLDLDGALTAADALRLIHIALDVAPPPRAWEWSSADLNTDGQVDVVDLVDLVDRVLGRPRTKPVPVLASWEQTGTDLVIECVSMRAAVVVLEQPGRVSSVTGDWTGAASMWKTMAPEPEARTLSASVAGDVATVFVLGDYGPILAHPSQTEPERLRVFPNPFNAHTALTFAIREGADVAVEIYSVLGQNIVELSRSWRAPGRHRLIWDGRDRHHQPAGSGVYLARLTTRDRTEMVRMVLLQ